MKIKYIKHADGRVQKAPNRTCTNRPARMRRAKGPGSMDCENEIMALAASDAKAALKLYDKHCARKGVRPTARLQMWAAYARA